MTGGAGVLARAAGAALAALVASSTVGAAVSDAEAARAVLWAVVGAAGVCLAWRLLPPLRVPALRLNGGGAR